MRVFPDAKDLPVEDCIDLLAVTVSEQVSDLKDIDYKAYAEAVMSAIEKNWRAKALRLHPDKIDSPFWSTDRKERLGRLFNYYNTAQEEVMKAFAQYRRVYGRSLGIILGTHEEPWIRYIVPNGSGPTPKVRHSESYQRTRVLLLDRHSGAWLRDHLGSRGFLLYDYSVCGLRGRKLGGVCRRRRR